MGKRSMRTGKVVKITSTVPLSSEQKNRIEDKYSDLHEEVSFLYSVDKSLIGGVKIMDGEHMYDGSVASKLIEIEKALK